MHLKELEIQGFKSFADKINIEFGQGITGIVGPNGSGKSNISDAIRWVMGEQSAKSLRGGNMQDVIFAGTQKRKPLGFAEVSLVIDNCDKVLPVDYDQVTITRRVFRSGESEYFINKSSVRLKDIHELFMDTGVGRDGYSIIGQGKISEIISTKSEDRRQMFEEAAGITKFRYRKEEAERKLANTYDNVVRVNDIIAELENQIEPLKIQSEKAKKYLNLRDELKILEVNVSLENIIKFKKSLSEVEVLYADVETQVKKASESIEKIEKETSEMYESINEKEQLTEQKREQQQQNTSTLSEHQSDIAILKNKIEHNIESIKRIENEITELNEKSDELEMSLLEKDDGFENLISTKEEYNNTVLQLTEELRLLDGNVLSENNVIEKINTDLIEKMNHIAEVRSKMSNLGALIDNFKKRAVSIEAELKDKEQNYNSLKQNVEKLSSEYEFKENEISNFKKEIEVLNSDYAQIANKSSQIKTDLQSKRNSLQQALSRQKLLKDMESSFDNYSRSVKSVMQSYGRGEIKGTKLYGTVAGLIEVKNEFATAIEVALGAAAQNIVTESENDAKNAIEYLKKTKQGRATFLPISAVKSSSLNENGLDANKGYIGISAELVGCDDKFKNIVSSLLGRVVVVDNIDNAVIIAKKYSYKFRIVTLEGDLLAPGGSMSGGSRNNSSGLFAKANEITQLDTVIKNLKSDVEVLETEDKNYDELSSNKKAKLDDLRKLLTISTEESIKLKSDASHSKTFLNSIDDARNSLLSESNLLTTQVNDMQNERNRYEEVIETIKAEIASLEKQSEVHKSGISGFASKRSELSNNIVEVKMSLGAVEKDIEMHNERIEMVNVRKQEINQNIEQKKQNIEEIIDANEDLQDDIDFKNQQIQDLNDEIENLKNIISSTDAERKKTQESIKSKQDELKKQRETQLVLQQEQGRIESKKTKAEVELENIISRLWDEYELTITTAEEYRKDIENIAVAQRRINELKEQIRNLGNINIDSIEEYKAIKERYDFLTTQRDDLVEAKKNLELVIADMVEIMKAQFAEKFKTINQYFGEVFVELFGGGRAQLKLTEPNDILGSGVEIDVQPPGKAVKNMLQLSGGEQAFVSIALLFAILKVRPSPFCVLDEIEAALDDINVFRFADFLKKFCGNSQFVVVTHRRGTMEAANMLYGVTMQEQGVTKLLSLNIDDVVEVK